MASSTKITLMPAPIVRDGEENHRLVRTVISQMPRWLPQMDGYAYHPAGARLHVYVSDTDWCMVFQLAGWDSNDAGCEHNNVYELHVYEMGPGAAQSLDGKNGIDRYFDSAVGEKAHYKCQCQDCNKKDEDEDDEDEDDEEGDDRDSEAPNKRLREYEVLEEVHPSIRVVEFIDGSPTIPIEHSTRYLREHGVPRFESNADVLHDDGEFPIHKSGMFRALFNQHRERFLLTENEVLDFLKPEFRSSNNFTKILQLDNWYHCDASKYEMDSEPPVDVTNYRHRYDHVPQSNPTFQALAQCIVDHSGAHYTQLCAVHQLPQPNIEPFTNWIEAGFRK